MEDASLMKQIAGGDEAALQALLRRYGPTYPFTGADEMSNGWYSDKRERHQASLEESLLPATAE